MESDTKRRIELMKEYEKIPMDLIRFRIKLQESKQTKENQDETN